MTLVSSVWQRLNLKYLMYLHYKKIFFSPTQTNIIYKIPPKLNSRNNTKIFSKCLSYFSIVSHLSSLVATNQINIYLIQLNFFMDTAKKNFFSCQLNNNNTTTNPNIRISPKNLSLPLLS